MPLISSSTLRNFFGLGVTREEILLEYDFKSNQDGQFRVTKIQNTRENPTRRDRVNKAVLESQDRIYFTSEKSRMLKAISDKINDENNGMIMISSEAWVRNPNSAKGPPGSSSASVASVASSASGASGAPDPSGDAGHAGSSGTSIVRPNQQKSQEQHDEEGEKTNTIFSS